MKTAHVFAGENGRYYLGTVGGSIAETGDGYPILSDALHGAYLRGYSHILAVDVYDILEDIAAEIVDNWKGKHNAILRTMQERRNRLVRS